MRVEVAEGPLSAVAADFLVAGIYSDDPHLPVGLREEPLAAKIAQRREAKDFEGKTGELLTLFDLEGFASPRVLLVGLGKKTSETPTSLARAAGTAARAIAAKKRGRIAFTVLGDDVGLAPFAERVAAIVSGVMTGSKGQDLYRTEKSRWPIDDLLLVAGKKPIDAVQAAAKRGVIIGDAINLTRDLVNEPPDRLYPAAFADRAHAEGESLGLSIEVFGPAELTERGMNCILGVAKGSAHEPRLVTLTYTGRPDEPARRLGLVGKGVTFDSGGLSLKTHDGMMEMKGDMAGAATMLGVTRAIARLGLPINFVTVLPMVENMPGASALRPGDVLVASNGKTIEVLNTDAEGRLILADALVHAGHHRASHLVDAATLTGACMVALGKHVAGVMTNDDVWARRLLTAGERVGERLWPLPMFDEYDELIKSPIADMKNIGGRWGGAITAAKLLAQFVGKTPWAHVDIAGPAWTDADASHQDGAATGFLVRTLLELAQEFATPG